jgi:alpha-N-arabinofuranosidase
VTQPVEINLTGATSVEKTGTLVSLSGNNPAETNTLSAPKRIAPVKTPLRNTGAKFSHSLPASSLQVIQLQAK